MSDKMNIHTYPKTENRSSKKKETLFSVKYINGKPPFFTVEKTIMNSKKSPDILTARKLLKLSKEEIIIIALEREKAFYDYQKELTIRFKDQKIADFHKKRHEKPEEYEEKPIEIREKPIKIPKIAIKIANFDQKKPVIESWVNWRIEKNKNVMACFVGETGSGKSYAAMNFLKSVDSGFNIDRIAINNAEFMNILAQNLPKGSSILYDEAGVGLSHKEFMSRVNRAVNFVLQTFRHKNYIVAFTSPNFGFIEKSSRSMFHLVFNMNDIDHRRKVSFARAYRHETNGMTGKSYLKRFRNPLTGDLVGRKAFTLPPPDLVEEYEKKKVLYTSKLINLMKAEVAEKDPFSDLTDLQREVYEGYYVKGMTQNEIGAKLGKPQQNISAVLKAVRRKGYGAKPVEAIVV